MTRPRAGAPPSALLQLDALAGKDPAMRHAVDVCRRVLASHLPVLITGETGVGKDTLARAIHAASPRSRRPYTAMNCAAIPASLLAGELFGYAPGTFTGGSREGSKGKLAVSDGGTVFLDEIGDMPLDLQAYLLRVLEDRSVTPLGSNTSIPLDIRFVGATHRHLPDLIARGEFRQDLYFRIRGVEVRLPPLRERSDLPDLVEHFVHAEGQACSRPMTLCPAARSVLCRYDWPGNIRELRSVIRVTLSLCESEHITVADLPSPVLEFARFNLGAPETCRCFA